MCTYGCLADVERTEMAAAEARASAASAEYVPQVGDRVEYFVSMDKCWVPGTITGTGDWDDGRPVFDVQIDPGVMTGGYPVMGRDRWGYDNQFRPLVIPFMVPSPVATKPIEHSPACLRAQAALAAYDQRWPGSCRKCGGRGILSDFSWHTGPSSEACEACLCEDRCARCGAEGTVAWDDEAGVFSACTACGFDAEAGDAGRPEVDCECWDTEA